MVNQVNKIDINNVFNQGILINIRIRKWGATKKANGNVFKDELNTEVIRAVQDLIEDRTILDSINSMRNKTKNYVKSFSIPFPIDGIFFIRNSYVERIDSYLEEMKKEYMSLVDSFLEQYEDLKNQFAERNPELFNPANYPTKEFLQCKFQFSWSFRQMVLSDYLPENLQKKEIEKFKADIEEMKEGTKNLIANELNERIGSLASQCVNGKLNSATLEGINGFLEKFDNIFQGFFDQKKLDELVSDVKIYLSDVTVNDLRADENFKNEVRKKMQDVVKELETIPDVKLNRSIEI